MCDITETFTLNLKVRRPGIEPKKSVDPESNQGPSDLQSDALPTELSTDDVLLKISWKTDGVVKFLSQLIKITDSGGVRTHALADCGLNAAP